MKFHLAAGVPESVEVDLLATVTTQFNLGVNPSSLAANTYDITIFGKNESFNPPPTNADLLNGLISVNKNTYPLGWADGESFQQSVDVKTAENFSALCSNAFFFDLVTIDSATCMAVTGALSDAIIQEHLAEPTTVPGDFQ